MTGPKVYTVSELSQGIKSLLETNFRELWVEGEISGLKVSSLGHTYFDLKDATSNISGVMFRGFAQGLKFELANGLLVRVRGNITTYDKICRKHETSYRVFFPDLNLFTLKKIRGNLPLTP